MSEELHPLQIAHIRRLSLGERLDRGLRFLRSAREFMAAGVLARHPDWTEAEARTEAKRLMQRHAGD
jgi:hypothetical protein